MPQKKNNDQLLKDLVLRSQQGDSEAFGKIYELLLDKVYRYVYFKVKAEDAGDICEDIFLRAWEKLHSYKEKKNISFQSWIFRIAHNIVIDYYRKNKEVLSLDTIDMQEENIVQTGPDKDTDISLTIHHLQKALKQLKDEYQQIILLKFINELSNDEIADILGKSNTSIRILAHRALKELQRILKGN